MSLIKRVVLLTVEYLVKGKFLNVALENSDLVDFQMSNLYLKWANQAMSDGWEVVTFARHRDHVPIVRGHLGSLRSMISAIISGDLQEGVDFEWAEEEQVRSLFFFNLFCKLLYFRSQRSFVMIVLMITPLSAHMTILVKGMCWKTL